MAIIKVEFSMQSNHYFLGSQTNMDLVIECPNSNCKDRIPNAVKLLFFRQSTQILLKSPTCKFCCFPLWVRTQIILLNDCPPNNIFLLI